MKNKNNDSSNCACHNRPISIKKRLILSIVSIATLLILISWAFIVTAAKHEIKEVYDARLGQSAKILALAMPSILAAPVEKRDTLYASWFKSIQDSSENEESETPYGHAYEANFIFQFYQGEQLVFKSPTAPDKAVGNIDNFGYNEFNFNDELWHSFVLKFHSVDNQELYVLVAEKDSIRDEVIIEIALSTSLPQLLLIPILAFVTLLLVNKFLHPIIELREAVALRSINNLEPINMQRATVELHPLVKQINYLLNQLNNAWEREKRFTRTAAHELKTPLAILRLNAENALNSNDINEQRSDLSNIISGINRTDRLIQQLLMHSRIEAQHHLEIAPCNVTSILREVIAQLVPLSLQQKQTISLVPIEGCRIDGNSTLLAILFTNLIDNSIRYSGEGSSISATMQIQEKQNKKILQILIRDTGKPIAAEIHERIFEKFFRADSGKGDGAGLGMSIANDIVKQHNGSLALQANDKEQGNLFIISLPML